MADKDLGRRLIGSQPRRTAIQLAIASILVGAFLAFWGVSPREFWSGAFNFFKGLVGWLGDSVGEVVTNLLTYLLFGAAIVIPVWLVMRVINGPDRRTRSDVAKKD
jgi:formate-dependent nitrite reductase membrane component NrfD